MDVRFTVQLVKSSARCFWIVLAAALLVWLMPAFSASEVVPVFGPKQYTRIAGPPQTFTETFEQCGNARCQLVITNGDADGKHRVSSASIFLNGVRIVEPDDFNGRVAKIVKRVVLANNNQLTIKLASKPGSFLTVDVECAQSPVVLQAGSPGVSLHDPMTLLAVSAVMAVVGIVACWVPALRAARIDPVVALRS